MDSTTTCKPVARCAVCKLSMYAVGELKQHRMTQEHINASRAMKAYCDHCDKCFYSTKNMTKHYNKVHNRPADENTEKQDAPGETTGKTINDATPNAKPATRCKICNVTLEVERKKHDTTPEHIAACKIIGAFCNDCEKCFCSAKSKRKHYDKKHRGESTAKSSHDATETIAAKPVRLCEVCKFPRGKKTKTHKKTPEHIAACKKIGAFCIECDKCFKSVKGLQSHYDMKHDPNRATGYHCCDCDQSFPTSAKFKTHMWRHGLKSNEKYACPVCEKVFLHLGTRDKHARACLRAKKDREERQIPCVGGGKCERRFKTPSAMVMHLESGACKSKLNRKMINELIHKHDTQKAITLSNITPASNTPLTQHQAQLDLALQQVNQQEHSTGYIEVEILSDSDSDLDSEGGGVLIRTPSISGSEFSSYASAIMTPIRTPSNLQCALCAKEFKSQAALEMHLNSPVHEPLTYHCPLTFMGIGVASEERNFKTLSGLIQHLEHGACKGGTETFLKAVGIVESLARTMGFDSFKLLKSGGEEV